MQPRHLTRSGTYYRVCDPSWENPRDTSYAKRYGGRWNVAGTFGALYLNRTIATAAANARRSLRLEFGDAVTFEDLRTAQRPYLQIFLVTKHRFVDAVTIEGIRALRLAPNFLSDGHGPCRRIALQLYRANEAGIAARSAVDHDGEELAIFDRHIDLARRKPRGHLAFAAWYPGAH